MRKTLVFCICLSACFTLSVTLADTTDHPVLKTRVRTLAAFKNGLGFVYRTGETKLKDGCCIMGEIPAAALGTLWIGTTNPLSPVQEVVSFHDKAEWENNATSLGELIALNVGKEVVITSSAVTGPIKGAIVSVPTSQPLPEELRRTEQPSYSTPRAAPLTADSGFSSGPPQVVMIRTAEGKVLAINQSTIQSVEFADNPETKTKSTVDVSRARIALGGKPKSAEITMAYLEKGITWSPSYLINIKDERLADVTLEAVLANDVEDLDDVDVSFVVGYPNFMFADSTSLLALQQSVGNFVQRLASSGSGLYGPAGPPGATMSQSIAYNRPVYDSWQPEASYSASSSMQGESNEDLYYYHQPGVTLKKGNRARYSVFTSRVPYEHIYQWDIPDSMNIDDRGHRRDGGQRNAPADEVWHALRITNTTKQPWTTAPALVVNSSMPVAQDVLKYIPAGGKNTLPLTVATDVRAEQTQTEASRTPLKDRSYDKVIVDGKLNIRNWKQKPVSMNVKKTLIGEVVESGQGGKVTKVARSLTGVNPTSEIVWDFDMKPGEERTLTYQYSVLIYR